MNLNTPRRLLFTRFRHRGSSVAVIPRTIFPCSTTAPIFLQSFSSQSSTTITTTTTTGRSSSSSRPLPVPWRNAVTRGLERHAEVRWQENLKKYRKFVKEHPKQKEESDLPKFLRKWLVRQRHEFQKQRRGEPSFLTKPRLKALKSLGVRLEAEREWSWDAHFEKLAKFVKENGGTFPSDKTNRNEKEETLLYSFCLRQRFLYKKLQANKPTRLTQEQIAKLDSIDFTWDPRESSWDSMYKELQVFYSQHGHCVVPKNYPANRTLAKWVDTQRTQYKLRQRQKSSFMTQRRETLLDRIDFAWDAMEAVWHLRYNDLVQHVKIYGMPSYKGDSTAKQLYRWLKYQKAAYDKWIEGEKSSMTQQRQDLLDELLGSQWRDSSGRKLPEYLR